MKGEIQKIYLTLIAMVSVILLEVGLFTQKSLLAFIAFFVVFESLLRVGFLDVKSKKELK